MKSIGIITNKQKDIDLKYTEILVKSILHYGAKPYVTSDIARELSIEDENMDECTVVKKSDIIMCLGGDGTFLITARSAFAENKPILGVNLGNLGFLAEVDKNEIDNAVKHIVDSNFEIEERMMLEATIIRNAKVIGKHVALNDVVVSRGALSRILHLKTLINDNFVDTFPGDGLILSSPTGATAYSLSAGGPVVEPHTELIIITPICPHILYSRSLIATGSSTVKVAVDEQYSHDAMVTIDGQLGYEIKGGDVIEVRKSTHTVKMVRMGQRNFFNVLRTKIYDRGEKLRKYEI